MKHFKIPKYRAGHKVKLKSTGEEHRVVRLSYDSGATWYELNNGKHYSENEIERA